MWTNSIGVRRCKFRNGKPLQFEVCKSTVFKKCSKKDIKPQILPDDQIPMKLLNQRATKMENNQTVLWLW